MKKFIENFLSMQTSGMLLLIFGASIGVATVIENDFGTQAAKAVVYNATWFNILLILTAIILTYRMFKDKLYRKEKLSLFIFHIAFLCILLGAGITRFISFEGIMHIRQGQSSNTIISDQTYVQASIKAGEQTISDQEAVLMSILSPKAYRSSVSAGGNTYRFKSLRFIPNAQSVLRNAESGGQPYIEFISSTGMHRKNFSLPYNDKADLGGYYLNFGETFIPGVINIRLVDGQLQIQSPDTITTMSMMGVKGDTIVPGDWHLFGLKTLYQSKDLSIVLTNFQEHGFLDYVPSNDKNQQMDAIEIQASSGSDSKQVFLLGGKGFEGLPNTFMLGDAEVTMSYGSQNILLPFALQLKEFQLERYPGSNSPSSYASEVVLIDEAAKLIEPHRIYMNNVLNYKGFRFFQSSYDKDELGTVLSVNHDYWGTLFTYLGYFFMTIGMALSLFNKNSRFALLNKIIRKNSKKSAVATALVIVMSAFSINASAQHNRIDLNNIETINKAQAEKFGALLVQTNRGRVKPVNSLASELLRKISRTSKLHGLIPEQVILGMATNQALWQQIPMIKVKDPDLKKLLGIEGKYASYLDFIDITGNGEYKLQKQVAEAYEKKPAQRNLFDKDVMAADERLNICYMVYMGEFLKLMPHPTDPYKSWYAPGTAVRGLGKEDSTFITNAVPTYLDALSSNNLQLANTLVSGIAKYQQTAGAAIIPSKTKTQTEILYNKIDIFNNLSKMYGLLGVFMIILIIFQMFKERKAIRYVIKTFFILILTGFVLQTLGLAARWYISGHAPWSDGYESMIYIGWVTMLAGILLAKRSELTLAATTVLASIILMVAHLSWMDPEITPLVPVLKSYWLTIHVSIITASYGFLALSAILGFLNLVLMIFKTRGNHLSMDMRIAELTAINEKALIIGLYMLTIGTFLGGVWANESWGRYWGWDPKETWALASILFYSFISHMQYVPGLKSKFSYNVAALVGFFSILMTYFGVNYYLSGLHSYAKGDPVPVPSFVYYAVAVIIAVSAYAYFNNSKFEKEKADK